MSTESTRGMRGATLKTCYKSEKHFTGLETEKVQKPFGKLQTYVRANGNREIISGRGSFANGVGERTHYGAGRDNTIGSWGGQEPGESLQRFSALLFLLSCNSFSFLLLQHVIAELVHIYLRFEAGEVSSPFWVLCKLIACNLSSFQMLVQTKKNHCQTSYVFGDTSQIIQRKSVQAQIFCLFANHSVQKFAKFTNKRFSRCTDTLCVTFVQV